MQSGKGYAICGISVLHPWLLVGPGILWWEDRGRQVLDLSRLGKGQENSAVVTDEVMDKVVPTGTYEQIANIFMQRYRELTDRVLFLRRNYPAEDEAVLDVIRQLQETSALEAQGAV